MIVQVILWGILYALPLFVRSDFLLTIFIFTFIYGILAVTFDLIFGFTGQLSMFHPAVFGVSAYMTYLLAAHYKLHFWVATVPSAVTAVVLAVAVESVCFKFRLKTLYFAVVTLFGQNRTSARATAFKGWLGRRLPADLVVRASQLGKLPRFSSDKLEHHRVEPLEQGYRYEFLVALCSAPRTPAPEA